MNQVLYCFTLIINFNIPLFFTLNFKSINVFHLRANFLQLNNTLICVFLKFWHHFALIYETPFYAHCPDQLQQRADVEILPWINFQGAQAKGKNIGTLHWFNPVVHLTL